MNAKQALRAASKHIEDLEDYNRRASLDIKNLYFIIGKVIGDGEGYFCDWCEDAEECKNKPQWPDDSKLGCKDFWMKLNLPDQQDEGEVKDDSQGILSAGPTCGK